MPVRIDVSRLVFRLRAHVLPLGLAALCAATAPSCFPDVKLSGDDVGAPDAGGGGGESDAQAGDATVHEGGAVADDSGTTLPDGGGGGDGGGEGGGVPEGGAVGARRLLAVGEAHACVIHGASRSLYCWGENRRNELGRTTNVTAVIQPDTVKLGFDPLTNVAEVTASGDHTCALTDDGSVRCWGDTTQGAIGNGVTAEAAADPGAPVAIPHASGPNPKTLALVTSYRRNCAVLSPTQVACWGVGNGLGPVLRSTPEIVPLPDGGISSLSIGTDEGSLGGEDCAITQGAPPRIMCWGVNSQGVCAVPSDGKCNDDAGVYCVTRPTLVAQITEPVQLAASATVACAVFGATRRVACWGGNIEYSQLGTQPGPQSGSGGYAPNPILDDAGAPLVDVANVVVAYRHTCAIIGSDRHVACWGDATSGRLGNGELPVASASSSRPLPQTVKIDGAHTPLTGVEQIAMTLEFGCALRQDSTVWCWGANGSGQLAVSPSTVAASGYAIQVALP